MMRYLVTVTGPGVCAKEPTKSQMGILIVNESHPYGRCLVDGQKTDSGGRMGYNVTLQLSGTQRLTQNVLLDIN